MYHGGGERGWHRGHPPRDIPAPRNHRSRPYRGGYREHRDHDGYGSYHENQCHDRSQFVEYSDNSYPEYYEENQSFNEYREPRESAYKRGGRHDSGYHKETYYRGSYQRGRGEPARYWGSTPEPPNKKYSHKSVKAHKKESENRAKTSTIIPAEKVIHNSGRTIVILTPGITEDESETKSSKAKSPERDAKPLDCEKPSQETAKLESIKTEDVIVESVVKEILTPPSGHRNETLPACNVEMEITETKKEASLQLEQSTKEEILPVRVNPGKRAHSEEKDADVGQREGESFVGKRLCNNQDRDEDNLEKTVQIPLLGCWGDNIPSESVESAASKSEQENTESVVICQLPDTAQELRTAFILAKKEQIEVAFAQDCKTFAFVANTLLKKDPSIEATVTSALRSTLQEMAGLCVQELNNFIDHYDSGV